MRITDASHQMHIRPEWDTIQTMITMMVAGRESTFLMLLFLKLWENKIWHTLPVVFHIKDSVLSAAFEQGKKKPIFPPLGKKNANFCICFILISFPSSETGCIHVMVLIGDTEKNHSLYPALCLLNQQHNQSWGGREEKDTDDNLAKVTRRMQFHHTWLLSRQIPLPHSSFAAHVGLPCPCRLAPAPRC